MSTKKTDNRPVFESSKAASASDDKALGARFAAFAALNAAGVTIDSIKGNGADYADFKEGVLVGWQGAAFAKKFLSTSDGKAILTGRKIIGQNAYEPVTKSKEDWARDVSGRVGKFRGYYADWIKPDVAADKPEAAKPEAAKPARKSGAKKPIKERILNDIAAIKAAVDRDVDADAPQLTPKIRNELTAYCIAIQDLVKK